MANESSFPALTEAIKAVGGYEAAGRIVGLSGKAVKKWERAGKLPRTEMTGETEYAKKLAEAKPGKIDRSRLLQCFKAGQAA